MRLRGATLRHRKRGRPTPRNAMRSKPSSRMRWLLLLAVTACSGSHQASPRDRAVDDFGDTVPVGLAARRIASLNPTTTELLFAMGDGGRLVGRTHWDNYPPEASA